MTLLFAQQFRISPAACLEPALRMRSFQLLLHRAVTGVFWVLRRGSSESRVRFSFLRRSQESARRFFASFRQIAAERAQGGVLASLPYALMTRGPDLAIQARVEVESNSFKISFRVRAGSTSAALIPCGAPAPSPHEAQQNVFRTYLRDDLTLWLFAR